MAKSPERFTIPTITNSLLNVLWQETGKEPQDIQGRGTGCVSCLTDAILREIEDVMKEEEGDNWQNAVDADGRHGLNHDQIGQLMGGIEGVMKQRGSGIGSYFTRMGYTPEMFQRAQILLFT